MSQKIVITKLKFFSIFFANPLGISPVSQYFARLPSESLYFYEIEVTYAIFDILKEADWMLFQPAADNFYYVPTILFYIPWKYK